MISVNRGRQFLVHVLPAVIRPLRILWNQIIGFLFLVLALWASPAAVRSIREFDGDAESIFRVTLSTVFIILMAIFAISSFRRAHKVPK